MLPILHSALRVPRSALGMLDIPLGRGQKIRGTPAQLARLAGYLRERTAAAPDPARLVRLQLWDGQVLCASYAELAALATALTARLPPADAGLPRSALRVPRSAARYSAPATIQLAAAPANGAHGANTLVPHSAFRDPTSAEATDPYSAFRVPRSADLVTQTLNARGTTGGLRFPTSAEAAPADPAAGLVSGSAQPYVAQVCTADPASPWGWMAGGPLYWTPAGHILVAAARIALAHHLLLAADQLLALRWVRSSGWDCFVPAALLNTWHVALAGVLAQEIRPPDHPTVRLPDPAS